jgi:hypothetical protein
MKQNGTNPFHLKFESLQCFLIFRIPFAGPSQFHPLQQFESVRNPAILNLTPQRFNVHFQTQIVKFLLRTAPPSRPTYERLGGWNRIIVWHCWGGVKQFFRREPQCVASIESEFHVRSCCIKEARTHDDFKVASYPAGSNQMIHVNSGSGHFHVPMRGQNTQLSSGPMKAWQDMTNMTYMTWQYK